MPRKPTAATALSTPDSLDAALAGITQADTKALHAEWRRLYRGPPPATLSRDLLLRGIAFKLQEAALGGLPPAAKRKLAAWTQQAADQQRSGHHTAPAIRLKSGATLLRSWHGRTHTVQVLEEGYEHQGQRYASLSHIARTITGAHWSGPRFFGLTKRCSPSRSEDSADA
jgi:hypothetical protein